MLGFSLWGIYAKTLQGSAPGSVGGLVSQTPCRSHTSFLKRFGAYESIRMFPVM